MDEISETMSQNNHLSWFYLLFCHSDKMLLNTYVIFSQEGQQAFYHD
jgi:hypothetical protein